MKAEQTVSCGEAEFYIAAHEPGHTERNLPLWSSVRAGAVRFEEGDASGSIECPIEYKGLPDVPGGFQLLNVLSDSECDQFIKISEALGYHDDAPVSLPRSIRHNNNFNWVVDESVDGPIWDRCKGFFETSLFNGQRPLGLNARFRFYRYEQGDFFGPHTDGAWPGSRVIDGRLVMDAYGDRISQMTFLIFLSGGYEGGRTLFHTDPDTVIPVHTPRGAVLVFPHGMHPQHCVHAGEEIISGTKDIIRTDVLYG